MVITTRSCERHQYSVILQVKQKQVKEYWANVEAKQLCTRHQENSSCINHTKSLRLSTQFMLLKKVSKNREGKHNVGIQEAYLISFQIKKKNQPGNSLTSSKPHVSDIHDFFFFFLFLCKLFRVEFISFLCLIWNSAVKCQVRNI